MIKCFITPNSRTLYLPSNLERGEYILSTKFVHIESGSKSNVLMIVTDMPVNPALYFPKGLVRNVIQLVFPGKDNAWSTGYMASNEDNYIADLSQRDYIMFDICDQNGRSIVFDSAHLIISFHKC